MVINTRQVKAEWDRQKGSELLTGNTSYFLKMHMKPGKNTESHKLTWLMGAKEVWLKELGLDSDVKTTRTELNANLARHHTAHTYVTNPEAHDLWSFWLLRYINKNVTSEETAAWAKWNRLCTLGRWSTLQCITVKKAPESHKEKSSLSSTIYPEPLRLSNRNKQQSHPA